jgi:hypothetical protein
MSGAVRARSRRLIGFVQTREKEARRRAQFLSPRGLPAPPATGFFAEGSRGVDAAFRACLTDPAHTNKPSMAERSFFGRFFNSEGAESAVKAKPVTPSAVESEKKLVEQALLTECACVTWRHSIQC